MQFRATIRDERQEDVSGIRIVVEAAFPGPLEAKLIDRLRADGDIVASLVATKGSQVIGNVIFSRVSAPFSAVGLGPVAVLPQRQGGGIGGLLIREGLRRVGADGWRGVFVLGDPAYYRRFGFDPVLARGFTSPYAGSQFMVLPLNGCLPAQSGRIDYAPAFSALD